MQPRKTCLELCTLGSFRLPALMLAGAVLSGHSQVFVSPGSVATVEGNGRLNSAPFNNVSRYQQIYAASEFTPLHGPRLITQIAFRVDATQAAPFTHTFTNIQFNLSTTPTPVSGLSPTFASNVGPDDTVVYSGPLTFTTANAIVWGNAKAFDLVVNLTTPFVYDPSAGNLLLDIRNFSTGSSGFFDGNSDASATPGVRLNFLDNSTSGASGTVQSFGLITRFTFQNGITATGPVVPELAALDQAMANGFKRAAELAPERFEFAYRYAESFYDLATPDWNAALKAWAALEDKAQTPVERQTMRLHAANVLIKQGKPDHARTLIVTVDEPSLQGQKQKLVAQLAETAKK